MVKFYNEIPDFLVNWIVEQEIFWVATAPLAGDGHVNVSPKGLHGVFRVVSPTRVWYEDMSGSGSETIAHLRENGRITVMFNAFQGAPRIARLFGVGTVHEWGTPEYTGYIPDASRKPGSRSVIVIDVHKVSTSCGYAVPFFAFQGHRETLLHFFTTTEKRDVAYESEHPEAGADEFASGGIKAYWKSHSQSIDGLPSVQCYSNGKSVIHSEKERVERKEVVQPQTELGQQRAAQFVQRIIEAGPALLTGFTAGLATAAVAWKLAGGFSPSYRV